MVKENKIKPHIQLRLTTKGYIKLPQPFPREKSHRTSENFNNRQGHGKRLKNSVDSLISDWQDIQEKRIEEGKPILPENAIPIILQIDPTAFDAEDLRKYGIEVIAELEEGYIVGASVEDNEFSSLQKKIEQFIKAENGGGKVPEIWEIIDGRRRPEYIISSELWNQWDEIKDEILFVVDVGISCIGTKSLFPDHPKQKDNESDDNFATRVNNWINKRDITYQQWDDIKSEREDEFTNFVQAYNGENLSSFIDGETTKYAELPDSFSCRIKISGKGLKDLVFNFPYIFDVSEPDEFAEIIKQSSLSDAKWKG